MLVITSERLSKAGAGPGLHSYRKLTGRLRHPIEKYRFSFSRSSKLKELWTGCYSLSIAQAGCKMCPSCPGPGWTHFSGPFCGTGPVDLHVRVCSTLPTGPR